MRSVEDFVTNAVSRCFREKHMNCAGASLHIAADFFGVAIPEEILHATIGMNGAGKYGAQCGLVEGSLMFIGIFGQKMDLKKNCIVKHCYDFAQNFEHSFSSLLCRDLRPTGFQTSDKPYMCEPLTCKAVLFSITFMQQMLLEHKNIKNLF